jgi:hypothetical protein
MTGRRKYRRHWLLESRLQRGSEDEAENQRLDAARFPTENMGQCSKAVGTVKGHQNAAEEQKRAASGMTFGVSSGRNSGLLDLERLKNYGRFRLD